MKILLRFLNWLGGPKRYPSAEEQKRLNAQALRSI